LLFTSAYASAAAGENPQHNEDYNEGKAQGRWAKSFQQVTDLLLSEFVLSTEVLIPVFKIEFRAYVCL